MGAVFYDLTPEEMFDLMCGRPEEEEEEEDGSDNRVLDGVSHHGVHRGTGDKD